MSLRPGEPVVRFVAPGVGTMLETYGAWAHGYQSQQLPHVPLTHDPADFTTEVRVFYTPRPVKPEYEPGPIPGALF